MKTGRDMQYCDKSLEKGDTMRANDEYRVFHLQNDMIQK